MNKVHSLIITIVVAVAVPGILFFGKTATAEQMVDIPSPKKIVLPTITPIPTKIQEAPPATLIIPSIGVNATVEIVGQIEEGRMAAPSLPTTVGWYMYGPKPGEEGNSVIDGHYDTSSGSPAVFYSLNALKTGDTITVITTQGKSLTFHITNVRTYPIDSFPYDQVFEETNKKKLNLITCGGAWNHYLSDYSHRTVVFSELVE